MEYIPLEHLHEVFLMSLQNKIYEKGISESARILGCSPAYVSRVYNTKQNISLKTIEKMIQLLGQSVCMEIRKDD